MLFRKSGTIWCHQMSYVTYITVTYIADQLLSAPVLLSVFASQYIKLRVLLNAVRKSGAVLCRNMSSVTCHLSLSLLSNYCPDLSNAPIVLPNISNEGFGQILLEKVAAFCAAICHVSPVTWREAKVEKE